MKNVKSRLSAILTASAAAMTLFSAMPVSAAESIPLMGDMDADCKVTANDAQLALDVYVESLVGNTDNTANAENGSGDIDMNGIIDVADAQNILNYFCQTLIGEHPLWASIRELSGFISYNDGSNYNPNGTHHSSGYFNLQGMYLEVGCQSAAPGETVQVPVYMSGVDELAGFQLRMEADARLECSEIHSEAGLASTMDEYHALIEEHPELKDDRDLLLEYLDRSVFANTTQAIVTWASGKPIDPRDGFLAGVYTYTIPEDAEPGTVYELHVDTSYTKFVPLSGTDAFAYTLLDGVIVVE